jgi:hypothetical protein
MTRVDPIVGVAVSAGVGWSVGSGRGVTTWIVCVGGTAVAVEVVVSVADCSAVAGEEQAAARRAINRMRLHLDILLQ